MISCPDGPVDPEVEAKMKSEISRCIDDLHAMFFEKKHPKLITAAAMHFMLEVLKKEGVECSIQLMDSTKIN